MANPKPKIKNRKSNVLRLWICGDRSSLAAFHLAVAPAGPGEPTGPGEPAIHHIYSRDRSAFYACTGDQLPFLQAMARTLDLDLEELDPGPGTSTTNSDKWRAYAQQVLLDHFQPGETFTTRDARRVLHTSHPAPVLISMVQSGQLIRTGYGRWTRYHVPPQPPSHV